MRENTVTISVLTAHEHSSDMVKLKYRSNYNHQVMFFGNGFGQRPPIAPTRSRDIIQTSPEGDRAVPTASSVVFDISIICLKFGIRSASMLARQTRLLGNQTLCSWPL